jgi:hypothetical protein
MSERTVKTQAGLDKALKESVNYIYIDSPEGVWITLRDYDRDSSHVEAWGSSHVEAWGSSHVEAWGSSHVVARDSSHVVAWGSSHVEAWDSSHVEARPLVAVHLHSARAEVEGGVVIDITAIDQTDPQTWCDMQGAEAKGGTALVYKAVDDNLTSGYGTTYPLGETVVAKDWNGKPNCGGGLHFGPTPRHARSYNLSATRYLACQIPLKHAKGITEGGGTAKVKARECVVLYEVDIDGKRLDAAEAVA